MCVCVVSQVSVQSANGEFKEKKQDIRLLSSITLIFPGGEVAKVFSAQTKSCNKSVSGTERSSVSLLLKCLCELRKICPFLTTGKKRRRLLLSSMCLESL